MESSVDSKTLVQRAYWLTKLRWIAAAAVVAATFVCSRILGISVQAGALYGIAGLLILYNAGIVWLLAWTWRRVETGDGTAVKRVIHVQISADLVILTVLLHFSGGVENPFVFFFIFHMIIASILLSVRESYLQATLAVGLFGLLVLLEYGRLIPHHCLVGYVTHCSHRQRAYVLGTFLVFGITLYLVVYMAGYIATRLKRAERAQTRANALLREKDRTKDEYVARLTHDVKGHLAAIESCLSVARLGPIEGQSAEFVERALKRTQKVAAFSRALLRLTEMKLTGQIETETFSLADAVRGAVDTARRAADEKSVTMVCEIGAGELPICGDRFSIEEMTTNLLLNAIKYTPAGGDVSVRAGRQGDFAVVEIADTGIGIPQGEQEKVFDEFYRARNAIQVERSGTGLGLSIVKHVVDTHAGTIRVQSREGRGTTFTVMLPVSVELGEPDAGAQPAQILTVSVREAGC